MTLTTPTPATTVAEYEARLRAVRDEYTTKCEMARHSRRSFGYEDYLAGMRTAINIMEGQTL